MDIAIIGLPQSGKSTVFNALTAGHSTSTGAGGAGPMQVGVVKVIDPRLAVLDGMYHPKKVIHPEIKYWDLPPIDRESASANQVLSGRQRNILQAADALLLVVRTFEDPALLHPLDSVDPARDVKVLLEELALADLEALERSMRASWLVGCRSTFCIHPRQVAAANEHLRPSVSDVAQAVETLRAYTEADRTRLPYGVLNGLAIDAQSAQAAQDIIDYAVVCDAQDEAKAIRRAELEVEARGEPV